MYAKETELDKGDYTLRLQLSHPDSSVLEKQKGLPLRLDTKLDGKLKSVSLGFARDHVGLFNGEKHEFKNVKVQPGEQRSLVINSNLSGEGVKELYADVKAGDALIGKIVVDGEKALGRELVYVLPSAPPKDEDKPDDPKEKQKVLQLQVDLAAKIEDSKERIEYIDALLKVNSDDLQLLVAKLDALEAQKDSKPESIASAADAIIKRVDEEALAKAVGVKRNEDTVESRRENKETDKKKKALLSAYGAKARALISIVTKSNSGDGSPGSTTSDDFVSLGSPSDLKQLDALHARYRQWADASDPAFALVYARKELAHKRCVGLVARLTSAASATPSSLRPSCSATSEKVRRTRTGLKRTMSSDRPSLDSTGLSGDATRPRRLSCALQVPVLSSDHLVHGLLRAAVRVLALCPLFDVQAVSSVVSVSQRRRVAQTARNSQHSILGR